ncbi:hypothetical protein MTO96_000135 [Rhipicephalus appendiculatus]
MCRLVLRFAAHCLAIVIFTSDASKADVSCADDPGNSMCQFMSTNKGSVEDRRAYYPQSQQDPVPGAMSLDMFSSPAFQSSLGSLSDSNMPLWLFMGLGLDKSPETVALYHGPSGFAVTLAPSQVNLNEDGTVGDISSGSNQQMQKASKQLSQVLQTPCRVLSLLHPASLLGRGSTLSNSRSIKQQLSPLKRDQIFLQAMSPPHRKANSLANHPRQELRRSFSPDAQSQQNGATKTTLPQQLFSPQQTLTGASTKPSSTSTEALPTPQQQLGANPPLNSTQEPTAPEQAGKAATAAPTNAAKEEGSLTAGTPSSESTATTVAQTPATQTPLTEQQEALRKVGITSS